MASTMKEKNIVNLRATGYLAADIAHRLPDAGRIILTPGPHERVVFLAHFIRGLGFPLHPFVRGLMFYYRLDFHDLAPNFILNISAFIVVCEAFLHIRPHFGLWLKTFNVKPKVVVGQQAECGGAMVGKMPNVTWIEGSFVETVKGWQSGWFYITEPRDANWVASPEFQSGTPMQLTSWEQKGLSWGESTELTGLQTCIKSMKDKNIKLVNVIQVMLAHRILPCQRRAFNLREFIRAEHQTLQRLYGMKHKNAWKALFKASEVPPPISEDRGLHDARPPSQVSSQADTGFGSSQYIHGGALSNCAYLFRIMWRQRSRLTVRLHCQKAQLMLS